MRTEHYCLLLIVAGLAYCAYNEARDRARRRALRSALKGFAFVAIGIAGLVGVLVLK